MAMLVVFIAGAVAGWFTRDAAQRVEADRRQAEFHKKMAEWIDDGTWDARAAEAYAESDGARR